MTLDFTTSNEYCYYLFYGDLGSMLCDTICRD